MNQQIKSDLQVMVNAENKLAELSQTVNATATNLGRMKEDYDGKWGEKAYKTFIQKFSETEKEVKELSENLNEEKVLIAKARENYEKAEGVSAKAVESISETSLFSTKNMFNN